MYLPYVDSCCVLGVHKSKSPTVCSSCKFPGPAGSKAEHVFTCRHPCEYTHTVHVHTATQSATHVSTANSPPTSTDSASGLALFHSLALVSPIAGVPNIPNIRADGSSGTASGSCIFPTWLLWFLHLPVFLCAHLCLWRWTFDHITLC